MHWGIRLRCRLCMEESRKAVLRLRSAIKVEEGEKGYIDIGQTLLIAIGIGLRCAGWQKNAKFKMQNLK